MATKRFIRLGYANMSNSEFRSSVSFTLGLMAGNAAFTTPSPTLIVLNTLLTTYSGLLDAYGTSPSARGTTAQKQALDASRKDLETAMESLAFYCENITIDPVLLSSAGWELRSVPNPVGLVGAVQDLVSVQDSTVSFGGAKITWKRPLAVPPGGVKAYNVYRSITSNFGSAANIATVTRGRFIENGLTNAFYYYWIIPISAAGAGAVSDPVLVNVALQP